MPRLFHQSEKGMLHVLLHVPHNSFPLKALHALPGCGGPALSSISSSCAASRIRAGLSTLTGWRPLFKLMLIAAEVFLESSRALQHFLHVPHYSRPPFIKYVEAAARGDVKAIHHEDQQVSYGKEIRRKVGEALASGSKSHIQAQMYKIFHRHIFEESDWAKLFQERLHKHLQHVHRQDLQHIDWPQIFVLMKKLSTQHALALIKTFSGSWCTGRRFQELSELKCIYGCRGARDDMSHYMYCDRMWQIVEVSCGAPRSAVAAQPLARLGLLPISLANLTKTHIAYTMYHDSKVGKRGLIEKALQDNDKGFLGRTARHVGVLAHKGLRWNTKAFARDALAAGIS